MVVAAAVAAIAVAAATDNDNSSSTINISNTKTRTTTKKETLGPNRETRTPRNPTPLGDPCCLTDEFPDDRAGNLSVAT